MGGGLIHGLAVFVIGVTAFVFTSFYLVLESFTRDAIAAGGEPEALLALRNETLLRQALSTGVAALAGLFVVYVIVRPALAGTQAAFARLTQTTEDALQLARHKSQFLANMSHEIRTPMNGVLGMVGLLLRTPLDPRQRRYAEAIEKAGSTLLTIINDVLDFSKLDAHKPMLRPVDCDLRMITQEVVELLAPKADAKGVGIGCRIDKDVPALVHADADRTRQIVTNLVDNAIKFSERGEVVVHLQREHRDDGRVWLRWEVTDQGIGVAPADQERVFEAFAQGDSSTTRKRGGTGLGLAISRELAHAMGGQMGVQSELGVGSRFWVSLPMAPESRREADRSRRVSLVSGATNQPPSPVPTSATSQDMRRVLVVEDNEINQLVAMELLLALRLSVDVVHNGQQALEAVSERPYALILMDCQMPEMDGYEATRCIRAMDGEVAQTPIIALTAHAMESERQKVLDAGMDDYLAKPVRFATLEQVLRHWIALPPATLPPPGGMPSADRAPQLSGSLPLLDPHASRTVRVLELSLRVLPESLAELAAAIRKRDIAATRQLAHRLRGSCMSIGASALASEAEALELSDGTTETMQHAERLQQIGRRTCTMLQEELDALRASDD